MGTNIIKETNFGNQMYSVQDYLFNKRKLFLTEDVNVNTCSELMKQIMYLDTFDKDKEITLYISSLGGDVISGLCLYDVLRSCESPITTVCIGLAASMGAVIFLAGDKRKMLTDSQLMIHDPSTYFGDCQTKITDIKERLEGMMTVRERLAGIIAARSGKSLNEIYKKTSKDSFFDAKSAFAYGLATEIVNETERLL